MSEVIPRAPLDWPVRPARRHDPSAPPWALHQRAEFTAQESVNSTGQLAEGHKVAVKGLHITSVDPHRLNVTSVISLADTCS